MAALNVSPHAPLSLDEIRSAQERIADFVLRTPLIPLEAGGNQREIFLKLELLQPVGSFKLRGALNAIRLADADLLKQGVWTASTGNMAQAVAWVAHRMGIGCAVVVPSDTPEAKLAAVKRLNGRIVRIPKAEWFDLILGRSERKDMRGLFIHPVSNRDVMAGHGTMGLEILEELPQAAAAMIPFGGGGLTCGLASCLRALQPNIRIYACELEGSAPVAAALLAGQPVHIESAPAPRYSSGFSNAPTVLPAMWPMVRDLVTDSARVTVAEMAAAIRLLARRHHVMAEGAAAAPVAAALKGEAGAGPVVCVVSGGHIDTDDLVKILTEE